jgi:hypothetical protein
VASKHDLINKNRQLQVIGRLSQLQREFITHPAYVTLQKKKKGAYDTSAWLVEAAGITLEEVAALAEGASSGKMRVVILEEYFLASFRKALVLTNFPSSSLAMEELTLS